jgi:hypothetical protein
MSGIDDIGQALVEARKAGGITQAQLADRLGVKRQQVQRWEARAYGSTSLARVGEVAAALGFDALVIDGVVRVTRPEADDSAAAATTPVTELGEIVARVRAHADEMSQTFGVVKIGVFGSFAEARQTTDSDVDCLVELSTPESGISDLEDYLGRILGRPVDVTTSERLRWEIRPDVLREVVRVWAA